jgi:SpoVK/Ycf46/Vps4 family AAA+-type ATPase
MSNTADELEKMMDTFQRVHAGSITIQTNPDWPYRHTFIGADYGHTPDPIFKDGDRVKVTDKYRGKKLKAGQVVTVCSSARNRSDPIQCLVEFVDKNGLRESIQVAESSLEKYVKPERPPVTFDSVILEEEKKMAVLDALKQIENHQLIFEEWGFEEVFEKGTAISFLFYGEPGTGKTLLAQAIADKLGKKLLVVGTAEIESSEPGGAERAIKSFFQNAKEDTVLLFDECDSLVYDRQGVGSILAAQVNTLLTCLEQYTGIVVFTTNRLGTLDEAFNRRLSLKVKFEVPDQEMRLRIWKRMFPSKAPLSRDINWEMLASIPVTGGYIKNAVLRAARLAAARGLKEINHKVLVDALKEEGKAMLEFQEAKTNVPRIVGRPTDYTLRKG